jgi:hypothetical protein
MLIVAILPSTLVLYLWAVLVWQWLCLSETCLKWQRRSKVPPKARCLPSFDFSKQIWTSGGKSQKIVSVYGNVMNRQNLTKWCREFSEGQTDVHDEKRSGRPSLMAGRRHTSMTRAYRSWFQDLINVWSMPATMLKNKVMYRQFIHSDAFLN